ncbi:MAG: alpha-N-arabinofuranosidase [Phenylobacterium sp.]
MRHKITFALAAGLGALALASTAWTAPAPISAELTLRADQPGPKIERNIYGQFAEHLGRGIYEGVWVGEGSKIPNTRGYRNDVIAALRQIRVPVVRWPGGCFADEYHWREGIGPRDKRPVKVNTIWGGVEEPNTFGTHEYMAFAEMIGAQTYVNGNVGTGSPREMSEWVEYMTSPTNSTLAQERRRNGRDKPFQLDFMAVGNETWGCGGEMRPEQYADVYRNYATFLRVPNGQKLGKIAVGANTADYKWTEALMAGAAKQMDALTLHYYTVPSGVWGHKGPAIGFDETEWIKTMSQTLRMEEFITRHSAIMDKYDPAKRVGLFVDEWGAWYDVSPGTNPGFLYQENTLRDGLLAAVNLNIFHAHADRVRMTNIAQMINVLQAMILTDKEKMVLTPTYHVYDMYKVFQGATELPLEIKAPAYSFAGVTVPSVHGSAGRDAEGVTHLGLVNLDPNRPAALTVSLAGLQARTVSGRVLTAPQMDARNGFDSPEVVKPAAFTGAKLQGGKLTLTLPPKSVVVVDLK